MLDYLPAPTCPDVTQVSFLIVGYGWRVPFFIRPALAFPDHFRVTGVVVRSDQRGLQVKEETGLPAWRSIEEAVKADRPDFVIVSVPWEVAPQITRQVVAMGLPVLTETPPAPSLESLVSLWNDVGGSGLVQVAEQYPRYPTQIARRHLIDLGLIGTVNEVSISQTHQYHGVGVLRYLLGTRFEDATVLGTKSTHMLLDPLDRPGWNDGQGEKPIRNVRGTLQFAGGKTGYYDFTDNQWFNPLRTDQTMVRGSRGEIMEDRVTWMAGDREILRGDLNRRQTGQGLSLEGNDLNLINLGERVLYKNRWIPGRLADDEIAVTDLLAAMSEWIHGGGPEPYPLAEGSQDWALALAIDQSIEENRPVEVSGLPWQ
jgi:Predicted dehydrogenases and related proteins